MSVRRSASVGDKVAVLLRTALQDERLSFRARGVLASVLSRPADWHTSAIRLARQSPTEGRDAIKTALIELEKAGYLQRNRYQNKKTGLWEWDWNISDDPTQFPPKPADEPQGNLQVRAISAGETDDGSTGVGSTDPGSTGAGSTDVGSAVAITGGRGTGGRSTGSRRNPPRPPDGVLLGPDGKVLDTELQLTPATVLESLVEAYAAAYRRAGGVASKQTRAVVARSCKRLITADGVPTDVLLAACQRAGGKRTKDVDSQLSAWADATAAAAGPTRDLVAASEALTPNVSPDDPVAFTAERRAITRAAAAGTLDLEAYAAGRICFTQPMGVRT